MGTENGVPEERAAASEKWVVRVGFTNGVEARQLLRIWASRTGVHAQAAGDKLHSSYHHDGQRHITGDNEKDQYKRRFDPPQMIRQKVPLAELIGAEGLHVLRLRNEPIYFTASSTYPRLGEKKRRLAWLLDSGALEQGATHELHVGIVGTGERPALDEHIADLTKDGSWNAVHSQLGERRSPSPYLVVLQANDESKHHGLPGWSSSSDTATLADGQPFTFRFPPGTLGPLKPEATVERRVWPPVPCMKKAEATIVCSPFAEPFERVGDLLLMIGGYHPEDPAKFDLVVNPRGVSIGVGSQVFYRLPEHPTAIAVAYRMSFGTGRQQSSECAYEHAGTTYYIKCRGLSIEPNGPCQKVTYHFEIQWNESVTPSEGAAGAVTPIRKHRS